MTDQELLDYYTQDFMSIRKNLDLQKQRSKKWLTDALQCQVNPREKDYFWDEFGIEFIENRKKIANLNRSNLKAGLKSDGHYHNVIAFGTGYCYRKNFYEIEQALGFDYCCDNDEQNGEQIYRTNDVCHRMN